MLIIHCILGKANPSRANGVNKVVHALSQAQMQVHPNIEIWGITVNLTHNYPQRAVQTRLFKQQTNPFKLDAQLYKALDQLKGQKVLFHLHGGFIPAFYTLQKALTKRNIQYVLTPHGAYNLKALEKSRGRKSIYHFLFESALIRHAAYIHLIGASEQEMLAEKYPKTKIKLIANGQDVLYSYKHTKSKDHLNFGFLGRIDMHTKGLDLLYSAMAKFAKLNQPFTLHIVGKGGEMQELKALGKSLNIDQHIIYHGAKYGEQKYAFLAELDIFFHPSRNEGMPGAVLEALSVETPCIVSKESNLANYINKAQAGLGMQELSASSLFKAIVNFTEQITPKHRKNAKSLIENEFDWRVIACKHLSAYSAVLNQND